MTSAGAIADRELVLLRLEDGEGHVGWGEAAPLIPSADRVESALGACVEALAGAGPEDHRSLLARCAEVVLLPEALAAVDLALWDLEGNRAGRPVWQLLGAPAAGPVPVNATIAAADRAGASRLAARARERGFPAVKLKVGLGDDAGRVAAVRAAAGPGMQIRLDANGAWSVEQARSALRALEPSGIELCEEPVHGREQIAELWRDCPVPLAIDETAGDPIALHERICDAVCLKIVACGGISGVLRAGRTAHAAGYEVYLASSLDGPLGIAAALHAAVALEVTRPCGLATLELFDGLPDPLAPRGGTIDPPAGPGLGVAVDPWYFAAG